MNILLNQNLTFRTGYPLLFSVYLQPRNWGRKYKWGRRKKDRPEHCGWLQRERSRFGG